MKVLLILAACLVGIFAEQVSYDGYKVYRIQAENAKQMEVIQMLESSELDFDFWSAPRALNMPMDVMVPPKMQNMFNLVTALAGIKVNLAIENVQTTIMTERAAQAFAPRAENGRISYTKYNRYSEIVEFIKLVAWLAPELATTEVIGKTHDGLDLEMIKICKGGCGNKPVILVDCGIHAREWIAPATCTYIIDQLTSNGSDEYLDKTDWFIIPVLNPDGYEYSHTNERFWRKTRSRGTVCHGTDGNRNFDFHWMETGASANECSETFAGRVPFSESETQALRDVVLAHKDEIKLYLTFHSYGQYLLYPWGYTASLPSDWQELDAVAVDVERAISAVAGTRYTIGSSTNVLYAAAGGSDDWVKGVGGVELSYTIELPGGGSAGFDLPPSRILPVVGETWEGVKVYQKYIAEKFGN